MTTSDEARTRAEKYADDVHPNQSPQLAAEFAFIAGAEWMAAQRPPVSPDVREAMRQVLHASIAPWWMSMFPALGGEQERYEEFLSALAAALLADESIFPPARVVTTVEELDALPVGSVVLDGYGEVWRRLVGGRWDCLDSNGEQPVEESHTVLWQSLNPFARVLYDPTDN